MSLEAIKEYCAKNISSQLQGGGVEVFALPWNAEFFFCLGIPKIRIIESTTKGEWKQVFSRQVYERHTISFLLLVWHYHVLERTQKLWEVTCSVGAGNWEWGMTFDLKKADSIQTSTGA